MRDPHPCLQRCDRLHIGEEVTHVHAFGLVKQCDRASQIALGLPYACHRDARAIPVLGQPVVLTQLLALHELLCGAIKIVALSVELTEAHVHVCRPAQHRAAMLRSKLQRVLIGAHRVTEATLCNADVRECDRATEYIGHMPGLLQTRHARAVGAIAFLKVPGRPVRQTQKPGRSCTDEMVVLADEV